RVQQAEAERDATHTRVITTVTELDALPVGSVVMTEEGWLAKKFETTQTQHWDVTERWRRGNYPDVRLIEHGPLTVLYEPEETRRASGRCSTASQGTTKA